VIDDPETPDVGVIALDSAKARWRVWANRAEHVELVLDPAGRAVRHPMQAEPHGFFFVDHDLPAVGTRYGYALDGGPVRPDPASRWQPDGIDAASAVYFPENHTWEEGNWAGIQRRDLVFYELHVGTFTNEGTFDAVIPRIASLRELGVTAIELMPLAQFTGRWNWGYDGVFPFAVQNSYGGPEALQNFVEACHREGMAVFLDVLYNHYGFEGNVLSTYGDYLTEKYKTDWGPAINYDSRACDPVRSMVLQNVRMWIRDFRFDGLRLDAADQIYDRSPVQILAEVADVAHLEGDRLGRKSHVFAETDLNDAPRFLNSHAKGGYALDGHWNDDFHHAVHVVLTGETNGYYSDFAAGPRALAKAFEEVFVNNGNYSEFRQRRHGTTATEFPGDRCVAFVQNHDQVGNRVKADRLAASQPTSALRLAAGLLLLAPRLPLLFMGEEYGETNPFPFFCDYQSPELINAVRKGRKAEFAYFGWTENLPDPVAPSTRESAVLSWSWTSPERASLREFYRNLLKLRRELPALRDFRHPVARLHNNGQVLEIVRGDPGSPDRLLCVFNLTSTEQTLAKERQSEVVIFGSEAGLSSPPERLRPHEFVVLKNRSADDAEERR
jgi:maltooligosyltrehalose trehalohydrolase